jgi:pimeloyl-ACP methyl ester carboxylesterase
MKDKFIPAKELDKWKSKFPRAKIIMFKDAGHFVQEEKPGEMVRAIDSLMCSSVHVLKCACFWLIGHL